MLVYSFHFHAFLAITKTRLGPPLLAAPAQAYLKHGPGPVFLVGLGLGVRVWGLLQSGLAHF